MQQFNIISSINQCEHTSVENNASIEKFTNNIAIHHYTDLIGRNRFVVFSNKEPIAAILFDENNTCMFRETLKEYRLQSLQSNLWLFAAHKLGNIKHSEDLTEDGKKLIK